MHCWLLTAKIMTRYRIDKALHYADSLNVDANIDAKLHHEFAHNLLNSFDKVLQMIEKDSPTLQPKKTFEDKIAAWRYINGLIEGYFLNLLPYEDEIT